MIQICFLECLWMILLLPTYVYNIQWYVGIAAFGDAPSAVLPATLFIATIGGLSGYAFSLIGRICAFTGANSYRDAWSKTIGEKTSIIPAASCTFKTSLAILAYSMVLADTGKALLTTAGINLSRTNTLLGLTSFCLLPLCLLKNLASLAPFSLLGVIGMGYTCFAMIARLFSGSYTVPAGALLSGVSSSLQPTFGTKGAMAALSPNSFILICMLRYVHTHIYWFITTNIFSKHLYYISFLLFVGGDIIWIYSTAYMAHFNAPKFYTELKNNTVKRYNILVSSSFAISIAIFAAIASAGFLTFGSASSGLILNNYANKVRFSFSFLFLYLYFTLHKLILSCVTFLLFFVFYRIYSCH